MFKDKPGLAKLASFSPNLFCSTLLQAVGMPRDEYKYGVSRIFFRAGQMAYMERLLKMPDSAIGGQVLEELLSLLRRRRWQLAARGAGIARYLWRRAQLRARSACQLQSRWRGLKARRWAHAVWSLVARRQARQQRLMLGQWVVDVLQGRLAATWIQVRHASPPSPITPLYRALV